MRLIVLVTSETYQGHKFWLKPGQNIDVGGDESAEIAFPATGLMPKHFRLDCEFDRCTLTSIDGVTYCNGMPVQQVELATGDRIQAGRIQFAIEITGQNVTNHSTVSAQNGIKKVGQSTKPFGKQQAGQGVLSGSWQTIRATDKATVLKQEPSNEMDRCVSRRLMITPIYQPDSMRVFRLTPPNAASANSGTASFFVAQHLSAESRERLSVTLQQIDNPLGELPSDSDNDIAGWMTQCVDDEVISNVLGLAAQGRGTRLERPHPEWMLRSADPQELSRLFVDSSDSFLDNLMDGFELIWTDSTNPQQRYVLVRNERRSQWIPVCN